MAGWCNYTTTAPPTTCKTHDFQHRPHDKQPNGCAADLTSQDDCGQGEILRGRLLGYMVLIQRAGEPLLNIGSFGIRLHQPPIDGARRIFDTFTGSNGTALGSHAPDVNTPGNAWVVRNSASLQIGNNRLVAAGSEPASQLYWIATIDFGASNHVVSMLSASAGNNANCGVLVRYNTSNNTHYLITHISALSLFAIFEYSAGSYTQRASASVSIALGVERTIVVTTSGTSIIATINSGNQISYGSASTNSSSTLVGIRMYDDLTIGDSYIDNFEVTVP